MKKLFSENNKLLKFNLFNRIKAKLVKLLKNYFKQRRFNSIISNLLNNKVIIDTIYDIGAFRGEWTNQLSKNCLKNKNFYLFEANIENEKYLSKYNHKYFIETLSNKRKKVKFYSLANTGDSYYLEQTSLYKKIKPKAKMTSTLDIVQKKK